MNEATNVKTYSDEFKNSIVASEAAATQQRQRAAVGARDRHPRDTLYGWRRQAGGEASLPATPAAPVGTLSSAEKFAWWWRRLSSTNWSWAYCRRKGLFAEQIAAWRATCRRGERGAAEPRRADRAAGRARADSALTRELQRKGPGPGRGRGLAGAPKKSPGRSGRSPRPLPPPGTAHRGERLDRRGPRRGGAVAARLRRGGADPAHLQALAPGGTLKADARRREHRPETRRYDPPNRLSPDERDSFWRSPTRRASPA
jgi:transposase